MCGTLSTILKRLPFTILKEMFSQFNAKVAKLKYWFQIVAETQSQPTLLIKLLLILDLPLKQKISKKLL